jgi:hypothetical protein
LLVLKACLKTIRCAQVLASFEIGIGATTPERNCGGLPFEAERRVECS